MLQKERPKTKTALNLTINFSKSIDGVAAAKVTSRPSFTREGEGRESEEVRKTVCVRERERERERERRISERDK